jgi:lysophospholipase L1-like esterase
VNNLLRIKVGQVKRQIVKKFFTCVLVLLTCTIVEAQYIRAFGDSFTEGIGANSSENYPNVLKRLLNVDVKGYGEGYLTSTEVVNRLIADSANKSNATIIWCGRNNYNDSTTVFYDIARAVASLGHQRYLILPIWASAEVGEAKGTISYSRIMAINQRLSEIYGAHYVPVREILVKAYNPKLYGDSASFAVDMVAARLRFQAGLHPNKDGYERIGKILSQYSVELGFPPLPGRWLGTVDGNINNPANWQGGVPTRHTNVVIHQGTPNSPQINSDLNCEDFSIGYGVNLAVTGKLKVGGFISAIGNLDVSNGSIELVGVPGQTVPPSVVVNNTIKNVIINYSPELPRYHTQAYTAPTSIGNYVFLGELAMEFKVQASGGIVIKQLGAFDHLGDGISGTQNGGVRVAIFYQGTQTIVPGLDVTISGSADPLIGNHRMRTITPVTLPVGDYVIVAKGYNNSELYGYHDPGNSDYGVDDGGGKISFTKSYSGDNSSSGFILPHATVYPTEPYAFLSGSFIFESPSGGVSLAGPLSVTGVVTPASGVLDTHKFLTVKSDAAGTARIAAGDSLGGYITGEVTVERYIPLGKVAYRQLASGVNSTANILSNWQEGKPATPVSGIGMHITGSTTGANGYDQTSGGGVSMFTYAAGAPSFTSIGNTNVRKLNALQAYRVFINGDRFANLTIPTTTNGTGSPNIQMNHATTIRATGTLITGPVTYNDIAAYANGIVDANNKLSASIGDFNMIANPYWSPVDFDLLTKSDISQTYWLWDPSIGNRGAYVTYNTLSGSTPGSSITKDIQPGQSIFMQTTGTKPSVQFNENNKSEGLTNTFRLPNQTPSKLSVKLFTTAALSGGKNMQDGTMVAFRDDFKKAISKEDAEKFTNTDENIAVFRDNQFLGVEGRPSVTGADTVVMRIWRLYSNNSYVLRVQGSDFDANVSGTLVDKFLNKQYPLNMNGSIDLPFTYSTDSASFYNRFMIVFRSATVLPLSVTSIKAYKKATGVQVEWKVSSESGAKEYMIEKSADGRAFSYAGTVAAIGNNNADMSYEWFDRIPVQGDNFYRIKAIGVTGSVNYTNVVKVNFAGKAQLVSIFPNPVRSGQFTIQLEGLEKGNYTIKVLDQLGHEVFVKAINITSVAMSEDVRLAANVSAGIYTILISNDKNVVNRQQLSIQ